MWPGFPAPETTVPAFAGTVFEASKEVREILLLLRSFLLGLFLSHEKSPFEG
jgi:hypothetical protein